MYMKFLCAIHVGCIFAMKCSIEQRCTSVILAGSMLIQRYYPALMSFNVPFNKYTIACFITMHIKISNSPTQSNSYDCGVFVCLVSYPLKLYEYIILPCIKLHRQHDCKLKVKTAYTHK